jgi:hypothetical protein
VTDAYQLVGLLADEERRRVVAALVLGVATVDDVRTATGLGTRSVATALAKVVDTGLAVRGDDGSYVLLGDAFRRAAIAAAPPRPEPDPTGDAPDDAAKVLRTFFREGRLTGIPAKQSQKRIVLDRLAQEFEIGVRYKERDVNAILRTFHDDVAALRRYLVDDEFLERRAGEYWRAGGTVT